MTKKPEAENGEEELVQQALVPGEEQPYKVPGNWVWVQLGTVLFPMTATKPDKSMDSFQYIDIDAIDNKLQIIREPKTIQTEKAPSRASRKIEHGNVLFSLVRPYLKNIAYIYKEYENCIASTGFYVCRPAESIKSRYLFYLLCSEYVISNATAMMKGDNSPSIRSSDLESVYIPLPPLPEQQRIINVIEALFAKLDRAKELLEEVQGAFEEQKATILARAFRGELTAKWREERGLDTQAYFQKVSNVCAVNPEKMKTTGLQDDLDVSFIPMAAVSETSGTIVAPEIQKFGKVKKGYTNFIEGDVLFAKITPCMENGKVTIAENLINGFGYGTTEFFVLRPGDKLNNRYLYHLLRSIWFRNEAKAVMAGAVGQQRVPKAFIEEYEFFFPSIQEQQEIVRILDDLLDKTSASASLCDQMEQIDQLKKTILAKAFRGELDTNDPAEESAEKLLREFLRQRAEEQGGSGRKKRILQLPKAIEVEIANVSLENIVRVSGKLSSEQLHKQSGIKDMQEFYSRLKDALESGRIIETRDESGRNVFFEVKP